MSASAHENFRLLALLHQQQQQQDLPTSMHRYNQLQTLSQVQMSPSSQHLLDQQSQQQSDQHQQQMLAHLQFQQQQLKMQRLLQMQQQQQMQQDQLHRRRQGALDAMTAVGQLSQALQMSQPGAIQQSQDGGSVPGNNNFASNATDQNDNSGIDAAAISNFNARPIMHNMEQFATDSTGGSGSLRSDQRGKPRSHQQVRDMQNLQTAAGHRQTSPPHSSADRMMPMDSMDDGINEQLSSNPNGSVCDSPQIRSMTSNESSGTAIIQQARMGTTVACSGAGIRNTNQSGWRIDARSKPDGKDSAVVPTTTRKSTEIDPKSKQWTRLSFPVKLHRVLSHLERHGLQSLASWSEDGKSFSVNSTDQLVNDVLIKFFKQSRFKSFQRQLGLHGFNRFPKGPSSGSFQHKFFVRDDEELAAQIVSKKRSASLTTPDSSIPARSKAHDDIMKSLNNDDAVQATDLEQRRLSSCRSPVSKTKKPNSSMTRQQQSRQTQLYPETNGVVLDTMPPNESNLPLPNGLFPTAGNAMQDLRVTPSQNDNGYGSGQANLLRMVSTSMPRQENRNNRTNPPKASALTVDAILNECQSFTTEQLLTIKASLEQTLAERQRQQPQNQPNAFGSSLNQVAPNRPMHPPQPVSPGFSAARTSQQLQRKPLRPSSQRTHGTNSHTSEFAHPLSTFRAQQQSTTLATPASSMNATTPYAFNNPVGADDDGDSIESIEDLSPLMMDEAPPPPADIAERASVPPSSLSTISHSTNSTKTPSLPAARSHVAMSLSTTPSPRPMNYQHPQLGEMQPRTLEVKSKPKRKPRPKSKSKVKSKPKPLSKHRRKSLDVAAALPLPSPKLTETVMSTTETREEDPSDLADDQPEATTVVEV